MIQNKPFSSNLSQTFAQSENNQMAQSRYIRNSRPHSNIGTTVMHSFFHDNPIQRFQEDLRVYKPVRYEPPTDVDRRSFVIVDQQVRYGDAITKEELQRRLYRSRQKTAKQHEIITYGRTQLPPYKPIREKQTLEVKIQGKKNEGCCAGCCRSYCGCCATCWGGEQESKKKQKGAIKLNGS